MKLDFLFNFLLKSKNNRFRFIREILFPFGVKLISKFVSNRINENLIVMGAYGGNMYIDNTKYLFEYLNRHSDYKLVWITNSYDLMRELKKKRINVVFKYDLKTIRLLRKAKFIFISHGYDDILPIEFSPKTTIILTWHGTPFKKVNSHLEEPLWRIWGKIFRLKLQFNEYVHHLLTPTGEAHEHKILKKAFKMPKRKFLDVGYPRNDLLFKKDENCIKRIKYFYKIPNNIKKIYLYAPTHRKELILKFPISKSELIKLNDVLVKTKSLLLFKGHIFINTIHFNEYENIKLVDKTTDIQELLIISDVLISDYSSVVFDYLITMKPILMFTYDLEVFKKVKGIYYDIEKIAPGPLLFSGNDLINAIKNIKKIDIEYKEIRKKMRDRFNKYNDGKSTERLFNLLNMKYS